MAYVSKLLMDFKRIYIFLKLLFGNIKTCGWNYLHQVQDICQLCTLILDTIYKICMAN